VNREYVDPGFRGIDWASAKESVASRIETGLDNATFTALMDETLSQFKDYHTHYVSPETVRADTASAKTQGFTGVGMSFRRGAGDYIVVVTVFPGPAYRAGIMGHDRILAVDGLSPLDARGELDTSRFRGPAGTPVRLLLASASGGTREITLLREQIAQDAIDAGLVASRLLPLERTNGRRIGYALLQGMSLQEADRLRAEFARLSADAPLDGFILDLRVNAGGELDAVASCLGLFYEGRTGKLAQRNGATIKLPMLGKAVGNSRTLPLVVLVHGTTHSAGELLAGALQHAGRASLVGGRTAGDTGNQKEAKLPGGGYINVTGGVFVLPDGSDPGWLWRGIEPDFAIPGCGWDEFTDEDDPALAKAIEILFQK